MSACAALRRCASIFSSSSGLPLLRTGSYRHTLLSVLFNQLRTRLNNLDSRHSIGINVIQVREIDQFPVNHHQWTRTVLRANGKPKSRIFDPPKSRPDLIRTSIYKCATDAFELSFLRLFRRDLDHPFRSLLAITFDRLLSFQYRHRVNSGGIQLRKAIGRNFLAINTIKPTCFRERPLSTTETESESAPVV